MRSGYVSLERARTDYGVVLDPGGEVDYGASKALRARIAPTRLMLPIVADEASCYEGIKSRHRVLRLALALAAKHALRPNQLVELLGRNPCPLRAWVRLDEDAPAGATRWMRSGGACSASRPATAFGPAISTR